MLSIGVLGSIFGTDLQAVIDAIESKKLAAKISIVISNKEDAYILERARKHNIEALFIDPKGKDIIYIRDTEKRRECFDKKISEVLDKKGIELILLIGYMRILSRWFVNKYDNKIMNIHPSLLPEFAGGMDKDVHAAVLKSGAKETGATLHFVDENVDSGPIIMQKRVKVEKNETIDSLKVKVQKAESEIIVKALKLYERGKIKIEDGEVKILE